MMPRRLAPEGRLHHSFVQIKQNPDGAADH
jgi:hypothetical protein